MGKKEAEPDMNAERSCFVSVEVRDFAEGAADPQHTRSAYRNTDTATVRNLHSELWIVESESRWNMEITYSTYIL